MEKSLFDNSTTYQVEFQSSIPIPIRFFRPEPLINFMSRNKHKVFILYSLQHKNMNIYITME